MIVLLAFRWYLLALPDTRTRTHAHTHTHTHTHIHTIQYKGGRARGARTRPEESMHERLKRKGLLLHELSLLHSDLI